MIPVAKVPKPRNFDAEAKVPGDAWLSANPPPKRPKDYWSPFLSVLGDSCGWLCGYAAMLDPTGGSVDHYLSCKKHRHLSYKWSNYRFVEQSLNSSKSTADDTVLDPFKVGPGWFEVVLPSLQMQVSATIPSNMKAKADFTLRRLKLGNGEKVIRWRRAWYKLYQEGKLDLAGLRDVAPLIADAVVRQQAAISKPKRNRAVKSAAAKRRKP